MGSCVLLPLAFNINAKGGVAVADGFFTRLITEITQRGYIDVFNLWTGLLCRLSVPSSRSLPCILRRNTFTPTSELQSSESSENPTYNLKYAKRSQMVMVLYVGLLFPSSQSLSTSSSNDTPSLAGYETVTNGWILLWMPLQGEEEKLH
ncbi:hypothetical protein RB195_018038 [Necator americanus]|uniref:Uncharacterized protein n=1 Tax=Necator americanus TaxID=51031 RepID=A0ABR1C8W9_NECAM